MSKRSIGPEAKIIALFTALPEDSKRIVFDVIRNQTATPRRVAEKKTQPTKPATCITCGSDEFVPDHSPESPVYHVFRAAVKKKGGKGKPTPLPDNPEDFHLGATA